MNGLNCNWKNSNYRRLFKAQKLLKKANSQSENFHGRLRPNFEYLNFSIPKFLEKGNKLVRVPETNGFDLRGSNTTQSTIFIELIYCRFSDFLHRK